MSSGNGDSCLTCPSLSLQTRKGSELISNVIRPPSWLYLSHLMAALHTLVPENHNSLVDNLYFESFATGTTFALLIGACWEREKKAKGFRRLKWRAKGLGGWVKMFKRHGVAAWHNKGDLGSPKGVLGITESGRRRTRSDCQRIFISLCFGLTSFNPITGHTTFQLSSICREKSVANNQVWQDTR